MTCPRCDRTVTPGHKCLAISRRFFFGLVAAPLVVREVPPILGMVPGSESGRHGIDIARSSSLVVVRTYSALSCGLSAQVGGMGRPVHEEWFLEHKTAGGLVSRIHIPGNYPKHYDGMPVVFYPLAKYPQNKS